MVRLGATTMSALAILAFLIGAVLGTRFRVLVLVPIIAIAIAAILGVGLAVGSTPGSTVLMAVATSICLQFGYLGGAFTRSILASSRRPPIETTPNPIETVR